MPLKSKPRPSTLGRAPAETGSVKLLFGKVGSAIAAYVIVPIYKRTLRIILQPHMQLEKWAGDSETVRRADELETLSLKLRGKAAVVRICSQVAASTMYSTATS